MHPHPAPTRRRRPWRAWVALLFVAGLGYTGWKVARIYMPGWFQSEVIAAQESRPAGPINQIIHVPEGYERTSVGANTFGHYLRTFSLKAGRPPIKKYDGHNARLQNHYLALLDIDIGTRDLQQCADAYLRLWAEYLWKTDQANSLALNFTSGQTARWADWKRGLRPVPAGNDRFDWREEAQPDATKANYRKFLNLLFSYCGTISVRRDFKQVASSAELAIGDCFVRAGSPGHLIFVVDMAQHPRTGKRLMLLAQGNTPAQDIHILLNANNPDISPWFEVDFGRKLEVPYDSFTAADIRRPANS